MLYCLYMSQVYSCVFLLVCISILMYVKHHEQFEIGCGAMLNKICHYYYGIGSFNLSQQCSQQPPVVSAFQKQTY